MLLEDIVCPFFVLSYVEYNSFKVINSVCLEDVVNFSYNKT